MRHRPRPPALSEVSKMRNLVVDPGRERSSSSPVEYIPFSVAEYVLTSPRGSESSPTALDVEDTEDMDNDGDGLAKLESLHTLRTSLRGKKKAAAGGEYSAGESFGSGGGGRPEFLRGDSFGSNGSRGSAGSAGSKSSNSSSVSSPRSPRTPTLTVDMSPLARKLYDLSQMNKRGAISSAEKKKLKREVIRNSSSQERRSYYQTIHAAGAAVATSFFS